MRLWPALVPSALSIILITAACSDDSSGDGDGSGAKSSESSCEKLCRRAGEADEVCAPSDCVSTCEDGLPKCNAEFEDFVDCMADAEMVGCETNSGKPMAINECESENDALGQCLLGGVGGGGVGGSGTGGEGNSGPCDPMQAACVGCGADSCGATDACCWGGAAPACGPAGSCTSIPSTCDGAEDCNGGSCCVSFLTTADGSASSGKAECKGGGGSVCCNATPGSPGCTDSTVESCVCAQDDYCCTMEWDAQCVGEVEQFGCGTCGAGCEMGNASTGTGSSIKSVACRNQADCGGVVGEFGVPYSECCRATNFGVGACVSQTYAGAIADSGGSCN